MFGNCAITTAFNVATKVALNGVSADGQKNMTANIDIDDLANPVISEAGKTNLAQLEAIPIDYSLDGMLEFAETQLDVPVFKEDSYLERLEAFIVEGDRFGNFSKAGKKFLASCCAQAIIHRSRMEDLFVRHPEINDEEIVAPIIIAGLPRSGTTNLSNIIGADSRLNSLRFWQALRPFPTLEVLENPEFDQDNREEDWKQWLDGIYAVCPYFLNMIDVPFDGSTEETALMHMAGTPIGYMNHAYTPVWNHWFWNEMDPQPMYDVLKRALQAQQWLTGGSQKRWILKSPHHLAFLPYAEKTFDNATHVITHRDPASSTISNAYMITYLYRQTHPYPNPAHGLEVAHHMGQGMIGGLVRDIDAIDPARVHHVYFHNYMKDVVSTVKAIYATAGLEWSETAEREIRAYVDGHPRGRHGRLNYHPERDFGQTRQQIRDCYQYYLDRFPARIEADHG